MFQRLPRALAALGIAAIACSVGVTPASATTVNEWGTWNEDGTITFANSNLIAATWTVNGDDSHAIITTDSSNEYFTADTPIGAIYGANGPDSTHNYLKVTTLNDAGDTDVAINITFDSTVAAGNLAIGISDIDSDSAWIGVDGVEGYVLTGNEVIGTASPSVFNFCAVTNPPSVCNGDTATATAYPDVSDGVWFRDATADTNGSSAWVQPSKDVTHVIIHVHNLDSLNSSSERIWIAESGNDPSSDSSGGSGSSGSTKEKLAATGVDTPFLGGAALLGSALIAAGLATSRRRRL
jgi:hypothetical protein